MTHTQVPDGSVADGGECAPSGPPADLAALADDTVALVRHWLEESARLPVDKSSRRLADVLQDPAGLAFTVGFIDGVIRPEDPRVAAERFAELASEVPAFLPWHLRAAVRTGGVIGRRVPRLVMPMVRRALRHMVGHLVVDATDARLGAAIRALRKDGIRLNLNLLGEAVLGSAEADRRLAGTQRLLERPDVDYVSIKVSATVAPHSPWAFEETVAAVVERLLPLYRSAARADAVTFINLDMEEYRDLDMTMAVFTTLLDRPELEHLEAGIVLQAYLPDALGAMRRLQRWSAARVGRGGAPVKVRLVKGANLPMERVEAAMHGWPLATWPTKQDTDANYKRVLDYALHPEHVRNVRIGVAGHNLFDVAFAWLLAQQRQVADAVEFEMLLGMAQAQAEVVRREVGGLLLYTPVVHPDEFDVAIAYLVRRLEEGASTENFMSAVFDLAENPGLFDRERDRFRASLAGVDRVVPQPNRRQDRAAETLGEEPMTGFANTADTDPSLPANRAWGRAILGRVPDSRVGCDLVQATTLTEQSTLSDQLAGAVAAAPRWAERGGAGRAAVLHRAGQVLASRRAALLEVMASETGKTLEQGDPEVSEAVDFAHYYAERAVDLDTVDGAEFVPARLTVVTPPWNFPVAIPAGSTLAALAAGSAVVIKPAPQARRCAAVMVQALWDAGVPGEVLRLVNVEDGPLGQALIADPRVDRVILTGAYETAELFRSFRPDLPVLAETSGKNAIVVTPSADFDLAARDVAQSAFGHAGQKCSAASLVILVGSVARSRRFRTQLLDAVSSLRVGSAADPESQVGPVIEPAQGKLLRGLTELGEGESWMLQPRRLDEEGRLWTPGVREGVRPGSQFHLTEYFGPVLGIMTAATLEEAIALQNQVEYGLTAGLHSLDRDEIATWLDTVQAGNLYVNRGITGAIVQRQSFGGWKKSVVGPGTKAGGPHYLKGLGTWRPRPARPGADVAVDAAVRGLVDAVAAAGTAAGIGAAEIAGLERAVRSDARAWREHFGQDNDPTGLEYEVDVLRFRPVPVRVRLAEGGSVPALVRVVAAGVLAGARPSVSTGVDLPGPVRDALTARGVPVRTEPDREWLERDTEPGRVRLIDGDPAAYLRAAGGRPDIACWAGPVTEAGMVELLPFLHEQAVSMTAHRFGTADRLTRSALAATR